MKKEFLNSFNKGIDQDTSARKYNNDIYYDAEDVRIISRNSLSNGALINVSGNKAQVKLNSFENEEVVAHAVVNDKLVFFTKHPSYHDINELTPSVDQEVITFSFNSNSYKFKFIASPESPVATYLDYIDVGDSMIDIAEIFNRHSELTDYFNIYADGTRIYFTAKGYDTLVYTITFSQTGSSYYSTPNTSGSAIYVVPDYKDLTTAVNATQKYNDRVSTAKLNFDISDHVSIVSRVESELLEKIYWTNGIDPLRSVNILDSFAGGSSSKFDYIPNVDLSRPSDTLISGGGLKSGVIQYSYQYYNKNGASTVFAPTDDVIRLSDISDTNTGGSNIGDDANKSVKIEIRNLDDNFDRIRIISIFYDTLNSTPAISIIAEIPFTSADSSISIVDSGNIIGIITAEEYNTYNQNTVIPKVLESKDNILFVGNITENTFASTAIDDWDARAYSYNESVRQAGHGTVLSEVYTSPLDSPTAERYVIDYNGVWNKLDAGGANIGSGVDWAIPTTHNSVNLNNSIYNNDLASGQSFHPFFNYNGVDMNGYITDVNIINGHTVYGGKGLNVEFTFLKYYVPDANADKLDKFVSTAPAAHPNNTGQECQPNEVYRVGIKFFNKKGQSSFVKWIADIRWPSYGLTKDVTGNYSSVLNVNIITPPDDDDIVGYQIVRAERTNADATITATGIIGPAALTTIGGNSLRAGTKLAEANDYLASVYIENIVEFISPETIFNDANSTNKEGDKLIIAGYAIPDDDTANSVFTNLYYDIDYNTSTSYESKVALTKRSYLIEEVVNTSTVHNEVDVYQKTHTVGDYQFKNQLRLAGAVASRCSGPVLLLDAAVEEHTNEAGVYVAHVMNNKDLSRYGGYSIQDRNNTTYIQFSGYVDIATTNISCEYGDIFEHKFSTIRGLFYRKNTGTFDTPIWSSSISQRIATYLPSRIACAYRLDNVDKYFLNLTSVADASALDDYGFTQETVLEGLRLYPETYETSIGDLYKYNNVYSQQPNLNISISKPTEFTNNFISPTKVLASNVKLNSEANDSWLNFLANNYIEVDGQFGDLTELISFKSNLFFFQQNAIGLLSVNDRSLIQDNNIGTLSLGTGGVLQRFDYLSYFSGAEKATDIIVSKTNIYFIDSDSRRIYTIDSPDQSFTELGGVHSLLGELITDDNKRLCGFDVDYNEVLFTIGPKTLCYNEITKSFTSRYSFVPSYYLTTPKALFTHKNDFDYLDKNYIYRHDIGDKGSWYRELYGVDSSVSKVSLLVNPMNGKVVTFDNMILRTDVYYADENAPAYKDIIFETVSRVKFSNSYINEVSVETAASSTPTSTIKRLARDWHTAVPLTSNGNRFTDSYLMVTLEFDNNSNKLFKLHDVTTLIR